MLSWNNDPSAASWLVFFNGAGSPTYTPVLGNTTLVGGTRQFIMPNLPAAGPMTVTMAAVGSSGPASGQSAPTYVTVSSAAIPVTCVAGCSGGGGSGSAVTVTNPATSAVQVAGSVTNTVSVVCLSGCSGGGIGFQGVSLQASAIALPVSVVAGAAGLSVTASQGSPWTVSGSVDVTSLPAGYLGVSVVSGVAGLTNTAYQGGPWAVSVSTLPSTYLGVSVVSGVAGISVTAAISGWPSAALPVSVVAGVAGISVTAAQSGGWTVAVSTLPASFQGVSIQSGVAGISVTASQGSPWTVSGSVAVTAWPAATLGVSVVAGVSNLTITAVPATGFTWTVSIPGTVQANIASAPAQNVTLTASNIALSVSITAWPAATLGVSVVAGVSNLTVTAVPAAGFTWTVSNPGVVAPVGAVFSITCTACPVPQLSAGNVLRYTATYFNMVTGTSKFAAGGAQALTMPTLVGGAVRFGLVAMFSVSATGGVLVFKSQGYTTDQTSLGTIVTYSGVSTTGVTSNACIAVAGKPDWMNLSIRGTNVTGVNWSAMPAGFVPFMSPFTAPNWSFDGSTQTLDWVVQRWDLWVYY